MLDEYVARAQDFAQFAKDYLGSMTVLVQLGFVVLLFPPAIIVGRRLGPVLKERARNIKGAVLIELWDALKANGIGIPYPHRELIVRSPVAVTTDAVTAGVAD